MLHLGGERVVDLPQPSSRLVRVVYRNRLVSESGRPSVPAIPQRPHPLPSSHREGSKGQKKVRNHRLRLQQRKHGWQSLV